MRQWYGIFITGYVVTCVGARDNETAAKLSAAFARGDYQKVQSLRLGNQPDETCWCAGNSWWLSTAPPEKGQ